MALSQWKEAILEGIFIEIEDGLVEEKNLERLENLVEILHKEGSKVPQSVKEAYCRVAVECTARCLDNERDSKEAYTEAIRSIWIRRIMPLCDKVSCLVTSDLMISCRKIWTAHNDAKACEELMAENTREKALDSLMKVVTELHPNIEYGYDDRTEDMDVEEESSEDTEPVDEAREIEVNQNSMDESEHSSEETGETEPVVEGRGLEVNQNSIDESEQSSEDTGENEPVVEGREIEVNQNSMDECEQSSEDTGQSEPVVKAREVEVNQNSMVELDESSEETGETEPMEVNQKSVDEDQGLHLLNLVSDTEQEREAECPPRRIKTIPSAVVDRVLTKLRTSKIELMNALEKGRTLNINITSITEQEHDVANPCATNKPSLMERRDTAQTYEWKDSINDSDGATDGDNKSRTVSPLKRNRGGRRTPVPWSTAETMAVLEGYEKYGSNWMLIKEEYPVLVRRTNVDIKDKYRVEMRRQERHP